MITELICGFLLGGIKYRLENLIALLGAAATVIWKSGILYLHSLTVRRMGP